MSIGTIILIILVILLLGWFQWSRRRAFLRHWIFMVVEDLVSSSLSCSFSCLWAGGSRALEFPDGRFHPHRTSEAPYLRHRDGGFCTLRPASVKAVDYAAREASRTAPAPAARCADS